jgi:hypothetical protein
MSRLLSFPARPWGKWIVFAVWIVIVGAVIGTNLPGKFTDAEENESTSFLPEDAESTRALQITERLQDGEVAPTVIVYRRDGGLSPADRQEIASDTRELNGITRRFENTTPFGEPQVSRDGTTALVANQIVGTGESDDIIDPVDAYREAVSEEGKPPEGLQVKVAGPAGVSADAIKIFENINGTLLLAALTLVIVLLIAIYRSPIFWFFPILAVIFAEIVVRGFGYGLTEIGVTVNGQSSSIMSILVIGAGHRLRAAARRPLPRGAQTPPGQARGDGHALRAAGPAIIASGLTVAVTLLSLTLAKVNGTAGLGPTGAAGVFIAIIAMLTFLPALLTIVGRRRFWPFVPFGPGGHRGGGPPPDGRAADPQVPGLGPVGIPFTILGVLIVVATVARRRSSRSSSRCCSSASSRSGPSSTGGVPPVRAAHERPRPPGRRDPRRLAPRRRLGRPPAARDRRRRRAAAGDHVARAPELLDGAHAGQLVPRLGRVDRGPGAHRPVVPERPGRPDRHHRARPCRRAGGRARGAGRRRRGPGDAAARGGGPTRGAAQRVPRARPLLDRGVRPDPEAARRGQARGAGRPRRRSDGGRGRPARGVGPTTPSC